MLPGELAPAIVPLDLYEWAFVLRFVGGGVLLSSTGSIEYEIDTVDSLGVQLECAAFSQQWLGSTATPDNYEANPWTVLCRSVDGAWTHVWGNAPPAVEPCDLL